jgi:hypothetical protein
LAKYFVLNQTLAPITTQRIDKQNHNQRYHFNVFLLSVPVPWAAYLETDVWFTLVVSAFGVCHFGPRGPIEQNFIEKFIQRNEATKRRIEEQESIGNIEQVAGGYSITDKGKRLIEIMRFVESLYPADEKRTIYPGWQND